MATIKPAPHISDIRGSIGNATYSHNRSGIYLKTKAYPRPSNTAAQGFRRAMHTLGVHTWKTTLTPTQRTAWNSLGLLTNWLNPIGNAYSPSGFTLFMRAWDTVQGTFIWTTYDPPSVASAIPPALTFTATAGGYLTIATGSTWLAGKTGILVIAYVAPVAPTRYSWFGPWSNTLYLSLSYILSGMPKNIMPLPSAAVAGDHFAIRAIGCYSPAGGPTVTWPLNYVGTVL